MAEKPARPYCCHSVPLYSFIAFPSLFWRNYSNLAEIKWPGDGVRRAGCIGAVARAPSVRFLSRAKRDHFICLMPSICFTARSVAIPLAVTIIISPLLFGRLACLRLLFMCRQCHKQ